VANGVANDEGHFNLCIPLRLILGFAEDYKKILLSARQELVFTRNRHDRNVLVSPTANEASEIRITKMSWYLPSIGVSDKARIPLLNIINKDIPITVPFRTWEHHENPAVPQTTNFTWTITSSSQLERPRYVLFSFQTNRKDNYAMYSNRFDHSNVTNMKLYLNSESFPYTNLNLDSPNSKHGLAYQLFTNFQLSYYNREMLAPCVSYCNFRNYYPIFVIDCSKQNERIKYAVTDIRLEVQTSAPIPANTSCHCLILHDRVIEYTPLSNLVHKH